MRLYWRRREPLAPVPTALEHRDAWLEHLKNDGAKTRTIEGYRRTTTNFLKRFPDLAFSEINDDHLIGFIEDASVRSRQSRRAPFANWFKWAERRRLIDKNPMRFVPTYKQPKHDPIEIFTDAEIATLEGLAEPEGTLMAILFGSGIRKAEARNLSVKRIDLEHAEINIVEGAKGGSVGVVPISQALTRRIRRLIDFERLGEDDFLWYSHPGGTPVRRHDRPVSDGAMHSWWAKTIAKSGVDYKNMHNTRHTYATRWRRRGLTFDDVGDGLRHADPRTTKKVYVHTKSIDLRKRMEAVAGNDW